ATPACQERYPSDDGKPHSREDGAAPTHPEGALIKQIRYQQDVKHALPVEVAYIAEDVIHALILPSRLSSPISDEEPFLLHAYYGAVEGLYGLGDELRRMGSRNETCHAHQIDAIEEHPLAQISGDRSALEQGGCVFLEVTEIQSRQARRLLADKSFEDRGAPICTAGDPTPCQDLIDAADEHIGHLLGTFRRLSCSHEL